MAIITIPEPQDQFNDGSWGKCSRCNGDARADFEYCPQCGVHFNAKITQKKEPKRMGRLLAICGSSATGKDFMARKIAEKCDKENIPYHQVISCTTRPPRVGEVDGKDYHFVTQDEFYDMVDKGEMLEYTQFRGWHYGTPKSEVKPGMLNIGVFNPQGVYSITKKYFDNILIGVVELQASFRTRLKRSISREGKFKFEFLRRAFTDHYDVEKLRAPCVENAKLFSYIDTNNPMAIQYAVDENVDLARFIHSNA